MTPVGAAGILLWIALAGTSDRAFLLCGVGFGFLLDRLLGCRLPWGGTLVFLARLCPAVVRALGESLVLVCFRKHQWWFRTERLSDDSLWAIVSRVYLVTLTPKTVVIRVNRLHRELLVHVLWRGRRGKQ
ncbi:MAG: Na+/H+ antiporter subunit E [Synergistales bacterium]|nr:Na+/H+ antiporter subunit E [Synergistales bacterium]